MPLPDVLQDNVTDACHRLGYEFVERIFYEAAKDAGFCDAKDRGMALHRLWIREGYGKLPSWVKDFILRKNEIHHLKEVIHITVKD